MNAMTGWSDLLLIPTWVSPAGVFLIAMLVLVIFVFVPVSFFLSFAERKLTADLQARVGPNRAGSHGILQGPADLLKELSRMPARRERPRKRFWQLVFAAALYSTLGSLPLGSDLIPVQSEISALLPLLSFTLAALALMLVGLESYHYETMLAALRMGFQHGSALLSAFLAILAAGVTAESLDWHRIAEVQSSGIISALVFQQPLLFFAFFSFQLSGMVLFGIHPFGTARRLKELFQADQAVGAFHEFFAFFAWSILSSALFLGAWETFGMDSSSPFRTLVGLITLLMKASILYLLSKVFSKALPQLRLDQMTDFSWKVLMPISVFTLIACAVIKTLGASA